MKVLMMILSVLVMISCSSRQPQTWDNGAQKQDSIQQQTENEQQDQIRNQFPGGRTF